MKRFCLNNVVWETTMRFKKNYNMYAPLGDANDLESHP